MNNSPTKFDNRTSNMQTSKQAPIMVQDDLSAVMGDGDEGLDFTQQDMYIVAGGTRV